MQLSGQFFTTSAANEAMVLTERSSNYSYLIIAALGLCLLLISAARLRQREVFLIIGQNAFFFNSPAEQYKNGIRENPLSSIFLVFQYIIVSGTYIYWYNHFSIVDFNTYQTIVLTTFPGILLLYHL